MLETNCNFQQLGKHDRVLGHFIFFYLFWIFLKATNPLFGFSKCNISAIILAPSLASHCVSLALSASASPSGDKYEMSTSGNRG